MSELEVVRWRRYGKDRLYVTGENGRKAGWVDLLTGERTLSDPECDQAFTDAVNRWYVETATAANDSASAGPAPAAIDVPCVPPTPADLSAGDETSTPWHDLAAHLPGQAAREQALQQLAAMKERTKVGTFLARAFDVKTEEHAWRVGASGEGTVGGRLEKLTKRGWHVLHAVPVGTRGSDIDHVVIGPGGVYTVNTKNHPGGRVWVASRSIRVNGQPVPYLRNSRYEGGRAEQLLSGVVGFPVPVRPALVFLTGTLIPNVTIKQRPEDVLILDRMDIPSAFKCAKQRLSADQIEAIFNMARRCTTWTTAQSCRCAL